MLRAARPRSIGQRSASACFSVARYFDGTAYFEALFGSSDS